MLTSYYVWYGEKIASLEIEIRVKILYINIAVVGDFLTTSVFARAVKKTAVPHY